MHSGHVALLPRKEDRQGGPDGHMSSRGGHGAGADIEPHPLDILAGSMSLRLEDARLEQERVVLLSVAIEAARDAARALDTWLVQSLAEHRGSRSAWDLPITTNQLRVALGRFDATVGEMAVRMQTLMGRADDRGRGPVRATVPNGETSRLRFETTVRPPILARIQLAVPRDEIASAVGDGLYIHTGRKWPVDVQGLCSHPPESTRELCNPSPHVSCSSRVSFATGIPRRESLFFFTLRSHRSRASCSCHLRRLSPMAFSGQIGSRWRLVSLPPTFWRQLHPRERIACARP